LESFQIAILAIEHDNIAFLQMKLKAWLMSCLPDRAEYLFPWNSCLQKYYLGFQPCPLQKWWRLWTGIIWSSHAIQGAAQDLAAGPEKGSL